MVHMPQTVFWPNDPMRRRTMHHRMVPRHMRAYNKYTKGQLVLQQLCCSENHSQMICSFICSQSKIRSEHFLIHEIISKNKHEI